MKHHLINPFVNFLLLSPIFIHAEDTLSICAGDVNDPNHPETCSTSSLFVQVENGLKNPKYDQTEVIYDFKKERYQMPIPDFVPVFEIQGDMESHSLIDLAKSARDVIDDNLPSSGAVLFRNLHQKINEASDFKEFWDGVTVSEQKGNWTSLSYLTNTKDRTQKSGVDTADNHPSRNPLTPHNEMAYDPKPPSRIAFYCMHEGDGGDTTLIRNKELSRKIPEEMKEFVKSHGGVISKRHFRSDPSEDPVSMNWQYKTGSTTKEEVIEYFVRRGWKEEDMSFKMSGGIDLTYVQSGFIEDEETGEEIWYNPILAKNAKTADGLLMPKEMREELIQLARDSTSSFRLKQGDWLVLDNFKVMHGRTQYKDITPEMPRTLLVAYTEQ